MYLFTKALIMSSASNKYKTEAKSETFFEMKKE